MMPTGTLLPPLGLMHLSGIMSRLIRSTSTRMVQPSKVVPVVPQWSGYCVGTPGTLVAIFDMFFLNAHVPIVLNYMESSLAANG